jgi:hypothetical protein
MADALLPPDLIATLARETAVGDLGPHGNRRVCDMRSGSWAWVVILAAILWIGSDTADAQTNLQPQPGRGFFDFLMQGNRARSPTATNQGRVVTPSEPSRARADGTARAAAPAVAAVPKEDAAKVVLVLGDSLAANLAAGLDTAFADTPQVRVVSKVNADTALVRADQYDWVTEAATILAATPHDAIVVMLGINDRQPRYDEAGKVVAAPRAEGWDAYYRERLDGLARALTATGKPVLWVGLPPTSRPEFTSFLVHVNDLARSTMEGAKVSFVDIWPGFTDDEGRYAASGPDIDGQERRLRASDGLHFTRSGQRKLAFFVEPDLRRLLEGGEVAAPAPVVEDVGPSLAAISDPWALPTPPWSQVGPVVALTGSDEGLTETELAGGPTSPRPGLPPERSLMLKGVDPNRPFPFVETPTYRRLVEGLSIDAPFGRIDDFQMPLVKAPRPAAPGPRTEAPPGMPPGTPDGADTAAMLATAR